MKKIICLFFLNSLLLAQTASIDLGKVFTAVKSQPHKTPTLVKIRRITAAVAGAANLTDYYTTHQAINSGHGCELNPFLQAADKCHVNNTRFLGLKLGILFYLGPGEELMHKLPHGNTWDTENIILNSTAAIWFTTISARNSKHF